MAFLTLGTSAQLQIKVPTNGTTSWGDTMKTDTFQVIAEHNHTGSGNGAILGTGSLLADAVTGAKIRLDNDEYLRGRNNADGANIDMFKVNTSDTITVGATILAATITTATIATAIPALIQQGSSVTLTDNTAVAATASVLTLASNEAAEIHYRIVRSTDVQSGTIEMEESNAVIAEDFIGDDTGVVFTNNAGTLEYTSSSTGNNGTMTYIITKK